MDTVLLKFFEDLLDDNTIIKIVELSEKGFSYEKILEHLVNEDGDEINDKV